MAFKPRDSRSLDEDTHLLRPLAGREYQVWELKGRTARNGKSLREWRLGMRMGPNASGIYPQLVSDPDATPPVIRKAGFREVLDVLR